MMHVLLFEESERGAWTFRARPVLFELTAAIQYFGRNRRTRVYQSRFVRYFFPHGTEVARGLVLINQSQVPAQKNRWLRQTPQQFFKGRSHGVFALERPEPVKSSKQLRVKLPK